MRAGLVDDAGTARLRQALAGYTVDSVHELLGLAGRAALERGDLPGVARHLRAHGDGPLPTLIRLFLLGMPVPDAAARRALAPLAPDSAAAAGLVQSAGGTVRALVDIRPYAQGGPTLPGASVGSAGDSPDWWVVSDFGADVRGGPLPHDHVLGVGSASLTLAQATPRDPVGRALDVGTGSGVQALHLGQHAGTVVATDVSERALRLAATTAALSGQSWDLRAGSLLEPVAAEHFDLVVANPPFVVSDGLGGYEYRDSGLAGDAVSAGLVRALPDVLTDGGSAHLLANWIMPADGDWPQRLAGWVAGRGCDAWIWQREVADPAEYVTLWLRDAGLVPGHGEWAARYDAWLDWFAREGVVAIGMGYVSLWRTGAHDPVFVAEDVPQAVQQPVGPQLPAWIARQRWLAGTDDHALLAANLDAAPGLVRERSDVLAETGWDTATARLRQSQGLRWVVDVDEPIAALVAASAGGAPVVAALTVLATALDRPVDEIAAAALPVVRDLVARGFLLPPGTNRGDHP